MAGLFLLLHAALLSAWWAVLGTFGLDLRRSERLLGASILAPEAGDLIMSPALAIRHRISASDLASAFHPYLTQAEGIRLAAQTFHKDVAKLSCCA